MRASGAAREACDLIAIIDCESLAGIVSRQSADFLNLSVAAPDDCAHCRGSVGRSHHQTRIVHAECLAVVTTGKRRKRLHHAAFGPAEGCLAVAIDSAGFTYHLAAAVHAVRYRGAGFAQLAHEDSLVAASRANGAREENEQGSANPNPEGGRVRHRAPDACQTSFQATLTFCWLISPVVRVQLCQTEKDTLILLHSMYHKQSTYRASARNYPPHEDSLTSCKCRSYLESCSNLWLSYRFPGLIALMQCNALGHNVKGFSYSPPRRLG